MKTLATILIFISATAFNSQTVYSQTSDETATAALQKVQNRLNSYETIGYKYYRSINYFSENYHAEAKGTTFLDFRSQDTILGFKYQLDNEQSKQVYNGTESFALNKKDSTIKIKLKPQAADFANLSLFLNSVVTIKKALHVLIADVEVKKTLSDTIINERSCRLVSFVLRNKILNGLGDFVPTTIKRNFLYQMAIDKETFLPQLIIQRNDAEPKDFMLTSFTDFELNGDSPTEFSWYYSTYTSDYKPASGKRPVLIKQNTVAPDWQLEYFGNDGEVTLSKLQGKVVLLEFWTKNCGYCIAAVPKLNAIFEKYKNKRLKVIGINTQDSKNDINSFYQRTRPNFKTTYDSDGKITNAYGVEAFPTVILVDKKGIIVYAGNFDREKIEKVLKSVLK